MTRVIQIWITHRWVLTLDIHAANLIGITIWSQNLAHDFYYGVTGLFI